MVGHLLHTECEPESWAWTGRKRVLVEGPDSWAWRPALLAAGYEVVTCRGPSPYEQCPLLGHGTCAVASAADTIVCALPTELRASVLAELVKHFPHTPIHRSARELLH